MREQAICILYCLKYNKEKATRVLEGIDRLNLDTCYGKDPKNL